MAHGPTKCSVSCKVNKNCGSFESRMMKQPLKYHGHKQFNDINTDLDDNDASARVPCFDLDCHDNNYIVPNSALSDEVATGHARRQLTMPMS